MHSVNSEKELLADENKKLQEETDGFKAKLEEAVNRFAYISP